MGVADLWDAKDQCGLYSALESNEAYILSDVLDILARHKGYVITWNGREFDLRFLLLRALKHDFSLPSALTDAVREWFRKYGNTRHIDLKAVLTDGDKYGEGLNEWCAFLGIQGKGEWDGSTVYPRYVAGEHASIQADNANEVAAIRALALRMGPTFGLNLIPQTEAF